MVTLGEAEPSELYSRRSVPSTPKWLSSEARCVPYEETPTNIG